ncbi:lycopene cyclase family protein [Albidovulum sp.]
MAEEDDVIVVGGGSAGCSLAARLSEGTALPG